jgi:2-haloacid dehalogenase
MANDFSRFDALTFDCYGTLIDWESGIATGLRAALPEIPATADDDSLLAAYATHEAAAEAGPYRPYRDILATAARGVAADFGVELGAGAAQAFGASVGDWPAFPDSMTALRRLKDRYRLGVITNCDDDLFAASNERLGVEFDWVITAQQLGSYKPNLRNFQIALERIGLPRERILHVAQSLFHDHVPAKQMGLTTAWINRRHGRSGTGATPPAAAQADVVTPDMTTFADLALARAILPK